MSDVQTLIARLEALQAGDPLPGDDANVHGNFTVGFYRKNTASLRTSHLAIYAKVDPVPSRLACELYDNLDTILAALRFWSLQHNHRDPQS